MAEKNDLQPLREAIEAVDQEILQQLKKRMDLVANVATVKLDSAVPLRDQQREERVLQRVRQTATNLDLDAHEIERLYRLIMAMSISRQEECLRSLPTTPIRVAYQGVEGSFSHLAAQRRYAGGESRLLLTGYPTFREAAEAVRDGAEDLGLLPIENTTAGSINETYDLLAEGGITIIGEEISAIEHCLLGLPGTEIEELRTVLSHPQGLIQCESFLRTVSWIQPKSEFDTAGAARTVRESGDRTIGAIASESAARIFGLEILRRGIQRDGSNYTRFVEVARNAAPCPADAVCKTSLMLTVAHSPGALGEVLRQFQQRGVNLSKLESRPVPGTPWEYRFYLDIEGHAASESVSAALETIRPLTGELRILGTYPRA